MNMWQIKIALEGEISRANGQISREFRPFATIPPILKRTRLISHKQAVKAGGTVCETIDPSEAFRPHPVAMPPPVLAPASIEEVALRRTVQM